MSTIRDNLLKRKYYAPYCGAEKCNGSWPRTDFDGKQFKCSSCGWKSNFENEFIEKVKDFNDRLGKYK